MKREGIERIKSTKLQTPATQTAVQSAVGMRRGGFAKTNDVEMGYFFGFPKGTYSEVLGELRWTQVNSCQTSSIPLADFWRPENLDRIKAMFAPHLPGFDPASALKFFEFPTEAVHDGKPIGNPSMTDIMVIAPGIQMAIEGKFTEYVKGRDQTIGEWLEAKMAVA